MKQLMSGIVPDPFQVSSKTIVTDENVTRDDAEDGDDAAEAQIDPERFTELAEKFGSKVSGMALVFLSSLTKEARFCCEGTLKSSKADLHRVESFRGLFK